MAILTEVQVLRYFNQPVSFKGFIITLPGFMFLVYKIAYSDSRLSQFVREKYLTEALSVLAIVSFALAITFYGAFIRIPSDQDIDDMYADIAINKETDALSSLNIQKEDLVRDSDWFWFASRGIGDFEIRYRTGADGVIRSNTRSLLYILYGDQQIMTYSVHFNIEKSVWSVREDAEYFYKDVIGVEVGSTKEGYAFTLSTAAGPRIFPLDRQEGQADGSRAHMALKAVRALIREKKSV